MAGRRVHERYDLELPVVVSLDGRESHTTTRNLSLGGMFIAATQPIPYGTQLTVRFQLPTLKDPTVARVIARWNEDGGVGLQWVSLRALEVWGLNQFFRARAEQA